MGYVAKHRVLAIAGAAFFAMGIWAPANGQDADDQRRGVARVGLINGDVSVRRGDSGDWVAAAVNAPLMTEDRIATGANSRVEVQFDSANVLRIGGNAEVGLTQLEYSRYQMEIAHGTVTFTVMRQSSVNNIEVDTPSVSVRPSNQGVYRITVNEAGETEVVVRSGQVEVFTPRGSQWVTSGQVLIARGPGADAEFQITAAPPLDDWDRWNQSRDRDITQAKSYKYVPDGVYGAEELDRYGTWVNADEYGWSWRPSVVAADWSPYSSGRWAWTDWYGWSWISYDPWGWAPYHYGRWFYAPRWGWCWYPGRFGIRQYWSPALVAFFGFGGGGGVSFGFGNVGWVPLAPFEPFHRWWGRGYYGYGGFNRGINITNINITNIYRNSRARNGIIGIREGDFRGGRFQNVRRFSADDVRQAGLVRGSMPFAPERQHLQYSDRGARNAPRANDNLRYFRRQQPNPVERVSFAQQQRAIEPSRFGRSPNDGERFQGNRDASAQDLRQRQSGPRQEGQRPAMQDAQRPAGQNSWRRFGDPSGQPQGSRSPAPSFQRGGGNAPTMNATPRRDDDARPANQNRGPWQRFGDPGSSPRQRMEPSRRDTQESPGVSAPRADPRSLRMGSPGVRERVDRPQSDNTPRRFGGGESPPGELRTAPRRFEGGATPRGFGGEASPEMRSAPRRFEGGSMPRFEGRSVPRMDGGSRGFGGGGSSPRSEGRSMPRMDSGPRGFGGGESAPRMQAAPRSFGGGGGGGPRGGGGGGDRGGQRGNGRR